MSTRDQTSLVNLLRLGRVVSTSLSGAHPTEHLEVEMGTVTVDWGDGQTTPVAVAEEAGEDWSISGEQHTYAEPGRTRSP